MFENLSGDRATEYLRYQVHGKWGNRWKSYLDWVARSLECWQPRSDKLVVFSSAFSFGLPEEFLKRFNQVTIVEPNAIARVYWRSLRHKNMSVLSSSILDLQSASETCMGIRSLQNEWGAPAMLFSNVFGGVNRGHDPHDIHMWFRSVGAFLKEYQWASYHTLFSSEVFPGQERERTFAYYASEREILDAFYGGKGAMFLADHATSTLAEAAEIPRHVFPWRYLRNYWHLSEFLYQ